MRFRSERSAVVHSAGSRKATFTCCIRGERGTRKEAAARAIHALSARRERPFVKISCASHPHSLEAEVFGCEHGRRGRRGTAAGRLSRVRATRHAVPRTRHLPADPRTAATGCRARGRRHDAAARHRAGHDPRRPRDRVRRAGRRVAPWPTGGFARSCSCG